MSTPQVTWDSPVRAEPHGTPQDRPQEQPQVSWDSETSKLPDSPTASPAPSQSALSELVDMGKLMPALIYSRVLGTDPHFAYQHSDDIEKQFSNISKDFNARSEE